MRTRCQSDGAGPRVAPAEAGGVESRIKEPLVNPKIRAALQPRLASLDVRVRRALSDPGARQFDPAICAHWFETLQTIVRELRDLAPNLLGSLPIHDVPEPSGTPDYGGRGCLPRWQMERLSADIDLVLGILDRKVSRTHEPA